MNIKIHPNSHLISNIWIFLSCSFVHVNIVHSVFTLFVVSKLDSWVFHYENFGTFQERDTEPENQIDSLFSENSQGFSPLIHENK